MLNHVESDHVESCRITDREDTAVMGGDSAVTHEPRYRCDALWDTKTRKVVFACVHPLGPSVHVASLRQLQITQEISLKPSSSPSPAGDFNSPPKLSPRSQIEGAVEQADNLIGEALGISPHHLFSDWKGPRGVESTLAVIGTGGP
eukprot:167855-Prorocentrum_minimum.AAC.1